MSDAIKIGDTFLEFKIMSLLGKGGFGRVFLVSNPKTKEEFALKVLHPQLTIDELLVKRFHREAGLAKKIQHPNVVRIHKDGIHKGFHFILMEYVAGKNMLEVMRAGPEYWVASQVELTPVSVAADESLEGHLHSLELDENDAKTIQSSLNPLKSVANNTAEPSPEEDETVTVHQEQLKVTSKSLETNHLEEEEEGSEPISKDQNIDATASREIKGLEDETTILGESESLLLQKKLSESFSKSKNEEKMEALSTQLDIASESKNQPTNASGKNKKDKLKPIENNQSAFGISTELALPLMKQCAAVLQTANDLNLIHRDIKPENLIFVKNKSRIHIKILDFGLAKNLDDDSTQLSKKGQTVGTPAYMSPEQFSGQSVDSRSDLYSLGASFYTFLTNQKPFPGPGVKEYLQQVTKETPVPPHCVNPKVDPYFSHIIMRLLEKSPTKRYQNGNELIEDLNRYERGDSPVLLQTKPLNETGVIKVHQENSFKILLLGLLFLTLGLVLGGFYLKEEKPIPDKTNHQNEQISNTSLENNTPEVILDNTTTPEVTENQEVTHDQENTVLSVDDPIIASEKNNQNNITENLTQDNDMELSSSDSIALNPQEPLKNPNKITPEPPLKTPENEPTIPSTNKLKTTKTPIKEELNLTTDLNLTKPIKFGTISPSGDTINSNEQKSDKTFTISTEDRLNQLKKRRLKVLMHPKNKNSLNKKTTEPSKEQDKG